MNRELGYKFEQQAVNYLKDNNYEILETNWYASKYGEIDIIALHKQLSILCFIEVKGRRGASGKAQAYQAITTSKAHKLTKSITYYLQTSLPNNINYMWTRIDLLIVFNNNEIEHIKNIEF